MLVAVLGSQSNFQGMAAAPLFILCGLLALLIHIALLALAARAFRFDLYLCGISSLAQIGGVASAPVLAATYTPVLVPIAVLLAMLGLILGTGIGLFMANVLSALAPDELNHAHSVRPSRSLAVARRLCAAPTPREPHRSPRTASSA